MNSTANKTCYASFVVITLATYFAYHSSNRTNDQVPTVGTSSEKKIQIEASEAKTALTRKGNLTSFDSHSLFRSTSEKISQMDIPELKRRKDVLEQMLKRSDLIKDFNDGQITPEKSQELRKMILELSLIKVELLKQST